MATWEIGNIDNSPIGQATPVAGAFTVLKAATDPADEHGVGDRGFNDLRYAGIGGGAKADALLADVKEANVEAISKGQMCAITGSSGTKFEVQKCDCDNASFIRIIGLAYTDTAKNADGMVVYKGILTNVDTRTTNTDVNPNGETWSPGDMLYVSNTPGGLTNVRPTSGRCIKAGRTLKGNSNTDTLLAIVHTNSICACAASGENMCARMGDDIGTNEFVFRNYSNTEVAKINSLGNLETPGIKSDKSTTSGDTRFLLYDVDNATFERVTVGAADSGGAGYKVLRIPN